MSHYQHFSAQEKKKLLQSEPLPTREDLQMSRLANVLRPCKPTIIVFRGAGVLGAAYPGVLIELEKQHLLEGITTVAGTSAGGLVAILVALGYSASEVKEVMLELEFNQLIENPHTSSSRKIMNFFRRKLDTGERLTKAIEGYIFKKLNTPEILQKLGLSDPEDLKNLTFAQLHALGNRDLYLTGTNKTGYKNQPKGETFFSFEHTPNMRIKDAGRATASHPFAFTDHFHNGNHYTDGAVSNPFPMDFFNKERFVPKGYTLTKEKNNPAVLGVAVDTEYHIKKQWNHRTRRSFGAWIFHIIYECFFRPLAFFGLYNRKKDHMRARHHTQIIQSYDLDIHPLDFKIDKSTKEKLIEHAELETRRYCRSYHGYDSYLPMPDETKPKSERYTYTSFENFKQKYEQCDTQTIERILRYELKPAIKRYKDRCAAEGGNSENVPNLKEGLALYREERRVAKEALRSRRPAQRP